MWLARESTQRCMWWRALWWTRWNHRIVMNLRQSTLERADIGELIWLGAEARDVLGRIATQCTVLRWILWHLVRPHLPTHIRELPVLDPWQRRQDADKPAIAETGSTVALEVHSQVVLDALLGAAIQGVAMRFPVSDELARFGAAVSDIPGDD